MSIPASIEKFLNERGVPYQILTHRKAYTAQEEAAVAHVPGREWAKTVVCFADGAPILAVLPALCNVDTERLQRLAGAAKVRLATEKELAPLYQDCEPGAMPPFGCLYGQRVFVDRVLAADPEIVFNAGTHVDAIRMRYEDFARLTTPVVGDFGVRIQQPVGH
jgi:Ala-tRNA(Pro) deacylase